MVIFPGKVEEQKKMPKSPRTPNLAWKLSRIMVLLGSSLIVIGLFLPWYKVVFEDGEGMTINGFGWYSQVILLLPGLELQQLRWMENLWTLGLAVLLILLIIIQYICKTRWLKLVLLGTSLLCARQLFFDFDFDSHLATINFWYERSSLISFSVSSQPTIVASYLGILLTLIGSIVGLFQNRSLATHKLA